MTLARNNPDNWALASGYGLLMFVAGITLVTDVITLVYRLLEGDLSAAIGPSGLSIEDALPLGHPRAERVLAVFVGQEHHQQDRVVAQEPGVVRVLEGDAGVVEEHGIIVAGFVAALLHWPIDDKPVARLQAEQDAKA